MDHVVTRPRAPFSIAGTGLVVHQLPAWRDNLIWLVVDPASGEAAAVDGPELAPVDAACAALGVRLTTILNTHTHPDHIGINRALGRAGRLGAVRVIGPRRAAAAVPGLDVPVDEGDHVTFGGASWRVLLTEGHLDGHISYVVGDVLFCGDTLFAGGCGYLFDGPPERMHGSLSRLAALPPQTRVCCAHEYTEDNLRFAWSVEPDNAALAARIRDVWAIRAAGGSAVPSTVAEERATNPFLRTASPTLRAAVAMALPGRPLATPAEVFAATRALKDAKRYRDVPDGSLPLDR